jgi:hypothetical protein
MDFWHGLVIGLVIGTNTGVVMAGLLKGCKREFGQAADSLDWLHMDQAVMEEAVVPATATPRPVATASPHPMTHSS